MDDFNNWRAPRMAGSIAQDDYLSNHLRGDDAPAITANGTASVVGNSVLSFVEGMSEQSKEDVRNSFLFASLVANRAHHPEAEGERWYKKFIEAMQNFGWIIGTRKYERMTQNGPSFTMDRVVIELLAGVAKSSASSRAEVLSALADQSLAALQRHEGPLTLFESNSRGFKGGTFSVGACSESADHDVVMALGTVNFTTSSKNTRVLFWNYQHSSVDMYSGSAVLHFHKQLYATYLRETIARKLGEHAIAMVDSYQI